MAQGVRRQPGAAGAGPGRRGTGGPGARPPLPPTPPLGRRRLAALSSHLNMAIPSLMQVQGKHLTSPTVRNKHYCAIQVVAIKHLIMMD